MKRLSLVIAAILSGYASHSQTFDWAKQWDCTEFMGGGPVIGIDNNQNIFLANSFQGTVDLNQGSGTQNASSIGNTSKNIFLVKSDASGNFVWGKQFSSDSSIAVSSVLTDNSGNVVLVGTFRGKADFDPGSSSFNLTSAGTQQNAFTVKLDPQGNFLWAKSVNAFLTWGNNATIDASGNIVFTGFFTGTVDFDPGSATHNLTAATTNMYETFVCKLDGSGNLVWVKHIQGGSAGSCGGISIDASGNILFSGAFSGTADFNPGSGTFNMTSSTGALFVCKMDVSGNFLWAKKIETSGALYNGGFLSTDASSNVILTGVFSGTIDFDPGAGVKNLNAGGGVNSADVFICQLDASGNFKWANQVGNANVMALSSVTTDKSSDIYCLGLFTGTVDFDPGPGAANLISSNYNDLYLSKYDQNGNLKWAKQWMHSTASSLLGSGLAVASDYNTYVSGGFSGTIDFDPNNGVTSLTAANANASIYLTKLRQTTTSVKTATFQDIDIYPNPSGGTFTIRSKADLTGAKITVRNMMGQTIPANTLVENNKIRLSLQAYPSGCYFAELQMKDGSSASFRLIKD
ncbi:MAG TPA: T9SS type A sorting domain-containing protein [Flavipsychrobacter sp.]|nr:T9SS type A sorting domain-containing protein [Flavipsychrobacter sp.]